MQIQVKIHNYSCFNDYTIVDKGDNWSRVVTKMVQLAGRYCERFASDIYYDINSYTKAIEAKENFDRLLFFRENGVTALSLDQSEAIAGTEYIQAWHLTYNADTEEQKLEKVSVYVERRYW